MRIRDGLSGWDGGVAVEAGVAGTIGERSSVVGRPVAWRGVAGIRGAARLRGGRLALVSGLLVTALMAVLAGAFAAPAGASPITAYVVNDLSDSVTPIALATNTPARKSAWEWANTRSRSRSPRTARPPTSPTTAMDSTSSATTR